MSSADVLDAPESFERLVRDQWVVPVLRYDPDDTALALRFGGLGVVGLTMTTPGVFEIVRSLVARDMVVGIGTITITDPAAVALAAAAGASFRVLFCLPDRLVAAARDCGLLAIPGAFTPLECFRAVVQGAHWIRIFSVRSVGPDYLRDLAPVLPTVPFVVSGGIGVSEQQLSPWHDAGVDLGAVGRELGTVSAVGAAEVSARAGRLVQVRDRLRGGGDPSR